MVTSTKFIKRLQVSYTWCHGSHVGTVPKKSCGEWTLVYEKNFFCSKKFAWLLTTWLKMTYQTTPQEITAQISSANSKVKFYRTFLSFNFGSKKRLQNRRTGSLLIKNLISFIKVERNYSSTVVFFSQIVEAITRHLLQNSLPSLVTDKRDRVDQGDPGHEQYFQTYSARD